MFSPHFTSLPGPVRPLAELIAARTQHEVTDCRVDVDFGALCFYRATRPTRYRKTEVVGPRLVVVAQGRAVTSFSDVEVAFDEGRFMVITGETTFETHIPDATPERPYLALCLELPPALIARTLLALFDGAMPTAPPVVAADPPAFTTPAIVEVAAALSRLIVATDDPAERKVVVPLAVEEIVFRLLLSEAAAGIRRSVQEGDASIDAAIRFIRENLDGELTVEVLARHVGMSRSHFAHRFATVTRVSPIRFLKQARLEAARELMIGENVRIQDAAFRVGYESASHFTTDFKKRYGVAPLEYIRWVRSGQEPRTAGSGN